MSFTAGGERSRPWVKDLRTSGLFGEVIPGSTSRMIRKREREEKAVSKHMSLHRLPLWKAGTKSHGRTVGNSIKLMSQSYLT